MTDRDLMKQALEALENLQGLCTDAEDGLVEAVTIWTPEIITALSERLAQPEQEPVACQYAQVPVRAARAGACGVCPRMQQGTMGNISCKGLPDI